MIRIGHIPEAMFTSNITVFPIGLTALIAIDCFLENTFFIAVIVTVIKVTSQERGVYYCKAVFQRVLLIRATTSIKPAPQKITLRTAVSQAVSLVKL